MNTPLFEIEVDLNDYNLVAMNDTIRMLVIQVFVQILFVLRNPDIDLVSNIFIENTLFIILGVIVYWLVFNHIIIFKNDNKDATKGATKGATEDNYYQKIYTQGLS